MPKSSFFERLFANLPDFVAVIDRDHRLVMCNWQAGYDYVPEQQRPNRPFCYEVFYPEQGRPCAYCHVKEVFRTGKPIVSEKVNPRIGHVEVRCFPIFDDRGEVSLVGEQICNINQRKETERALQESEQQYRALVESQTDLVCRWRPDTTLTFVNASYCRYFGKTRQELLGRKLLDLTPEPTRTTVAAHVADLLQNPHLGSCDTAIPYPGGEWCWISWRDCPIYDVNGRVIEFQSVGRDFTERKKALEQLRASEERYRQFFENDLTADFVATANGRLLDCNPAFLRIFGFNSLAEAQSCHLENLLTSRDAHQTLFETLRRQQVVEYLELEACRPDGTPLHLIANAFGEFDDRGRLTAIKGYLFDNTELKKLEKQFLHAQKMEAMGRLAGGVAHDFNNLLTVISGFSQYLLQNFQEQTLHDCLAQIVKAGDQAADLTRQLLTFSRRQVLQARDMDLNAVTADMEKMLRRIVGADIELAVLRDARLGLIKADRSQIEQVILNLAVNARDAMPVGGKLTIETINIELDERYSSRHLGLAPGPYVMLTVGDTGIGMDSETLSHIFEPFFTTKETGKGTGLGLSTVYGIVQQSNGHIQVYSEPGMGSVFKIYLPRIDAPPEETVKPDTRPPIMGDETVLLVEDNDAVRELTRMVLCSNGYQVLEACTPAEAERIFDAQQDPVHILVTDVVMPGGSGPDLAHALRQRQPDLKVLFISGYPQDLCPDLDPDQSDTCYLQKPFTPVSLGLKMREVLG